MIAISGEQVYTEFNNCNTLGGFTMKKQSTWRFVLKIIGASLAAAGAICLVVGYWDRMLASFCALGEKCRRGGEAPETDDYADELLYE